MEHLDKILQKKYHELTSDERLEIRDLCDTELAFEMLKDSFSQLEKMKNIDKKQSEVSSKTKESLDYLFVQTHRNKSILWYNGIVVSLHKPERKLYDQPWVKIAAVLVLIISIFPIIHLNKSTAPLIVKIDDKEITNEKLISTQQNDVTQNDIIKQAVSSSKTKETTSKTNLPTEYQLAMHEDEMTPPLTYSAKTANSVSDLDSDYRSQEIATSKAKQFELLDLLTPTF